MERTSRDTSPEADAVQRRIWARMGPERRVALALEMSDDVRRVAVEGVMARQPELTPREALFVVLRRTLGAELFDEAFARRHHGA